MDAGCGTVTIYFVQHPATSHTAVWLAPGVVHRWDAISDLVGELVLFLPTAPVTPATCALVTSADLAARWHIFDEDWPLVDAARNHIVVEATAASSPATELPQILLSALVARLRPPRRRATAAHPTFQMFQTSVEMNFRTHHDVGYYARTLGYAPRTVSRAVQKATGRTAKAYIVDRIVLESKRLLAHDRITSARCATELGFTDASSFSLFFRTATGLRPGAWQRATVVE